MTPLGELALSELGAFILETLRLGGMVIVAPLSWAVAPLRVRAGLVLFLALAAHSFAAPQTVHLTPESMALAAGTEFLLGAAIGFVVRMVVAVAEIAADVSAPLVGLGVAQMFDPSGGGTVTVLGSMLRHFAILLAILVGVHRVVIHSLMASFKVLPVGSFPDTAAGVPVLLSLSSTLLAAGVRIAVPLLAILFMTQVALAFISRAAPAMQIFSVGFAVTLAVGAVVLTLIMPDIGYRFMAEFSHIGTHIETLLFAISGGRL